MGSITNSNSERAIFLLLCRCYSTRSEARPREDEAEFAKRLPKTGGDRYTRLRLRRKDLPCNLNLATSFNSGKRNLNRFRHLAMRRIRGNFAGRTRLEPLWKNMAKNQPQSWKRKSRKCARLVGSFRSGRWVRLLSRISKVPASAYKSM